MLPVDGRNRFGRDGFLTHSYLLRGGRAESHGCVAFKDYQKFLRAFKQGKIRQIVVVPSDVQNAEGASGVEQRARELRATPPQPPVSSSRGAVPEPKAPFPVRLPCNGRKAAGEFDSSDQ